MHCKIFEGTFDVFSFIIFCKQHNVANANEHTGTHTRTLSMADSNADQIHRFQDT